VADPLLQTAHRGPLDRPHQGPLG